MRKLFIIGLISLASITLLFKTVYHRSYWYSYATHKKGKPPRELVKKAASYLSVKSPTAIDVGAGVGNETLYLLQQGYTVTSVEPDTSVVNLLTAREELQSFTKNLTVLNNTFEDISWSSLAPVDLFVASYSLPYVRPEKFPTVWNQIVDHIKPEGYFVGQLFTPEYGGFKEHEREAMTFLRKEEIAGLFKDFIIKQFSFVDEESTNYAGEPVRANYYEVIAQKRN